MRAFWWDGFWASACDSIALNYFGLYLLAFGASASQVGLLSSLSSLFAAIAFIPGAALTERVRGRKTLVLLTGGGIARLALLAVAAVPFVAHGGAAIWLLIGIASFRGFWGQFAIPAWTSLTADVVPIGIRGRFLASRNFGMSIATLAVAPVAGFLIDAFTGLGGWQLVWLMAFVAGAISTWFYSRIPEPAPHAAVAELPQHREDGGLRRDLLSDRNLLTYLGSVALWNVALQVAGPFFNVYLDQELGASTAMIGFIIAVPSITGLVALPWIGRMMDDRGTKWLMVVTGLTIPALPAAWLLVTAPWQVVLLNIAAGVLWAGYHLATMNLIMVMAPAAKRARYAAAFQTVTFAASFAGPLLGGLVIEHVGFHAIFALSAIGRLAATGVLLRVDGAPREPRPSAAAPA